MTSAPPEPASTPPLGGSSGPEEYGADGGAHERATRGAQRLEVAVAARRVPAAAMSRPRPKASSAAAAASGRSRWHAGGGKAGTTCRSHCERRVGTDYPVRARSLPLYEGGRGRLATTIEGIGAQLTPNRAATLTEEARREAELHALIADAKTELTRLKKANRELASELTTTY